MKRHGFALLGLTIIAIAAWTYNVNYDTRLTLDRVADLRDRIARERETLQVLRVEWAYLNAPDRLERLVAQHNDKLGLRPVTTAMLGDVGLPPFVAAEDDEPIIRRGHRIPKARPVDWRPQ